jgi:hypothetical protein
VLAEFEGDAGDGRGGTMLDGERDAIVGVAAEMARAAERNRKVA